MCKCMQRFVNSDEERQRDQYGGRALNCDRWPWRMEQPKEQNSDRECCASWQGQRLHGPRAWLPQRLPHWTQRDVGQRWSTKDKAHVFFGANPGALLGGWNGLRACWPIRRIGLQDCHVLEFWRHLILSEVTLPTNKKRLDYPTCGWAVPKGDLVPTGGVVLECVRPKPFAVDANGIETSRWDDHALGANGVAMAFQHLGTTDPNHVGITSPQALLDRKLQVAIARSHAGLPEGATRVQIQVSDVLARRAGRQIVDRKTQVAALTTPNRNSPPIKSFLSP